MIGAGSRRGGGGRGKPVVSTEYRGGGVHFSPCGQMVGRLLAGLDEREREFWFRRMVDEVHGLFDLQETGYDG